MKNHPESWHELTRQYAALGTIQKAADTMGICYSTARKRLVSMGVELNSKSWKASSDDILSGEDCRKKREERGLSQAALCEISGVTVATISTFETGNRTPRASTVKQLARALGLAVGE